MAELLTVALAANAQIQFRKAGSYIEIIDSTYSIGINFYSDLGGQTDSLIGALSGFFLGSQFGAFDIKNGPTAQTVQLLVLDPGETGGSRRQPGVISITNKISANVQTQGIGGLTTLGFQASMLVNPTANTKGLIIRGSSIGGANSVGGGANFTQLQMLAAPTAPTSLASGNCIVLSGVFNPTVNYQENQNWDKNITLPAGWGVWAAVVNNNSVGSSGGGLLCYELVT